MALKLHEECISRLIESIAAALPNFEVRSGWFLQRTQARVLLREAEAILPRQVKGRLEAYIDENPLTEFVLDSLAYELRSRDYESGHELTKLTDIQGYQDARSVARRLVDSFDQLPRRYRLTVQLPYEFWRLLSDSQNVVDLSPTTRLLRPDAAFSLVYPITKPKQFGLLAALGAPDDWNFDALYLQIDVTGFVGIYGGSTPHLEAQRFLRSFFGLGLALGLFEKKYAFASNGHSIPFQIHEQQASDEWLNVASVNLPDNLVGVLEDLRLSSLAGKFSDHVLNLFRVVFASGQKGESILLAAQWFFDASGGADELLRYVQSMVVLEILLGDKQAAERVGLNELLRSRCAYLIAESQEERDFILSVFNEIYDVRSRIVHRGKHRLTAEERSLLIRLQGMCSRVIYKEVELLRKNTRANSVS